MITALSGMGVFVYLKLTRGYPIWKPGRYLLLCYFFWPVTMLVIRFLLAINCPQVIANLISILIYSFFLSLAAYHFFFFMKKYFWGCFYLLFEWGHCVVGSFASSFLFYGSEINFQCDTVCVVLSCLALFFFYICSIKTNLKKRFQTTLGMQ